MNILLINHYAGSPKHGMEYRPYYLAKEWVKLGHKVTIVGASYSHLRSYNPDIKSVLKEEIDGIKYVWLKTPCYQGNGIKRALNIFSFSLKLYVNYKFLGEQINPDVVIASSPHPFIIYGAKRVSEFTHAKLIFEVRDLWPLTLKELGNMSSKHPFIAVMQWTENFAYKVSDKVVSLLPKAKEYMIAHGLKPNKFIHIPNGINTLEWNNSRKQLPDLHLNLLKNFRKTGYFTVGYTGYHGLANALNYLIEAAGLLKDKPVNFVFVGQGTEKGILQEEAMNKGLSNVFFLPPVKKIAIPNLLSCMDVLYIGCQRNPLYKFGISPNKLMDYMMSGKPVIHAVEAGNDLVKESGCGISIDPENPNAIAKAVEKLMNLDIEELRSMGEKGKEFIMRNHDYAILAKQFLDGISQ